MTLIENLNPVLLLTALTFLIIIKIYGKGVATKFEALGNVPHLLLGIITFAIITGPLMIVLNTINMTDTTMYKIIFGGWLFIWFVIMWLLSQKDEIILRMNWYYPASLLIAIAANAVLLTVVEGSETMGTVANNYLGHMFMGASHIGQNMLEIGFNTETINNFFHTFFQAIGAMSTIFGVEAKIEYLQVFMLIITTAILLSGISKIFVIFDNAFQWKAHFAFALLIGATNYFSIGLTAYAILPIIALALSIAYLKGELRMTHISFIGAGLFFWMPNPFAFFWAFAILIALTQPGEVRKETLPIIGVNVAYLSVAIYQYTQTNVIDDVLFPIIISAITIFYMLIIRGLFENLFVRTRSNLHILVSRGVRSLSNKFVPLLILPLAYAVYGYVELILNNTAELKDHIILGMTLLQFALIAMIMNAMIQRRMLFTGAKIWLFVMFLVVNPLWYLVEKLINSDTKVHWLQSLLMIDGQIGTAIGLVVFISIIIILNNLGKYNNVVKRNALDAEHEYAAPITMQRLLHPLSDGLSKAKQKRRTNKAWKKYEGHRR